MATKAAKKATKRKPAGKQNVTPALACPYPADLRRSYPTEATGRLATAVVTLRAEVVKYKTACRKHFADGGSAKDCPQFDPKHYIDITKFAQTQAQYDKLVAATHTSAEVYFAPKNNPVVIDAANAQKAIVLRRGAVKKHPRQPASWDDKTWGPWKEEDEDGNFTIPSGWFFDKGPVRRCHSEADKLVTDPGENILTFGNHRYVVGDGTNVRCATMLVSAFQRGNTPIPPNYWSGDSARKRMSIAGDKEIPDVIFKIEDRPNNGGGFTVKADWGEINEMVFMPGQILTAGFLHDAKGKRLSAKAIRALDGDTKGLRFKTVRQVLGGPIIGKLIAEDRLWTEIQSIQGTKGTKQQRERESRSDSEEVDATPQGKSLYNLKVTARVSPAEAFPFGGRAVCCDVVPYSVCNAEGEISWGVVVGDRSNTPYNVGANEAKASVEVEAPKKAAEKPADAAPPVESDTADEVEAVKETVEA